MALIVLNTGERAYLQTMIAPTQYIHLYRNDYTPVPDSVVTNFTPATFPGYAPIVHGWGAVGTNAQGQAQVISSLYTWTFTGGTAQTIYGYYWTDGSGASAFIAERAPQPIPLTTAGDSIKIQITLTLESLFN